MVGLRLIADFGGLPQSRHSSLGASAPGRAGVFCSMSPAASLTAAGSSFTCAKHASPPRRAGTTVAATRG